MTMYQTLRLDHDHEVATLTLNRPEKHNALSPEMMAELHAALDEIERSPARVMILTGAGKSFCAGMDLATLESMAARSVAESGSAGTTPSEEALADSRRIGDLFRHVYDFPKPLIAAVNGHAVAGGCGLATLCDFTLAVPEAKFGYTEVRVGFMPAFVTLFLIRQIGEKRARDLLLSGRILGAEEALRLGLVNEIVVAEKLADRARELASQLLAASPTSLRFTKRLISDFSREELDRELEIAIQTSARIRSTADFHEGLRAFLEKRSPQWKGH
jgi:methylglutaconyl-CoA hydratase